MYILGALILVLAVGFFLGPKVQFEPISFGNEIGDINIENIDNYLFKNRIEGIKSENESVVIWADSIPTKTKFVLVYLNGFSASRQEGEPINKNFAKRYGMNYYFPRLESHGLINPQAFEDFSPDAFFDSAEKAIELAKTMGDSLILMSCSTGGTLSILLAGRHPEIHSYFMFSPNIDIADPRSNLMIGPWGKQITKLVLGGEYNNIDYSEEQKKYWYSTYHLDGLIALKHILAEYMTNDNFANIKEPLFMGYYYKNDEIQDHVVSVSEMHNFYEHISTSVDLKFKKAYPDAGNHVISSNYMSKSWEELQEDVFDFAENTLHLMPLSEK